MSTVQGGQGAIVTDGLVLWLDAANPRSYDYPYIGTTWRDLSGNNNTGTLINGPTYNSSNGGSIVFDGVDDYVNITNQIQFERTNPFTLAAWANSTNVNNNQIINNENASYRGYQLGISNNGTPYFFIRSVVTTSYIGLTTQLVLSTNQWYYIVGTYDGSSNANGGKIYINGISVDINIVGNNLTTTTISNETTWIGRRRPATTGPFVGRIPQVQIYNRALSQQEVLQNFNATRARFGI
jgi:hypothetical protein